MMQKKLVNIHSHVCTRSLLNRATLNDGSRTDGRTDRRRCSGRSDSKFRVQRSDAALVSLAGQLPQVTSTGGHSQVAAQHKGSHMSTSSESDVLDVLDDWDDWDDWDSSWDSPHTNR